MTRKLNHFGYCIASGRAANPQAEYRGHEFHYSRWQRESEVANLWKVRKNRHGSNRMEGYSVNNLHASYVHLHFSTSSSVVGHLLNLTKNDL